MGSSFFLDWRWDQVMVIGDGSHAKG